MAFSEFWKTTAAGHLANSNAGGVVIGPAIQQLPAGYRLYVSEGILTERIKVAVKDSKDWSDHVFRADYKLPSLNEVEEHILSKGHLPGMPSAQEVVEQGNDLHRTDARLLEKIEELTLYLLEIKKEVSLHVQRIQRLEQENLELKHQISRLPTSR